MYLSHHGSASHPPSLRFGAAGSEAATESINGSTNWLRWRNFLGGVCRVLVLISRMLKGGIFLAFAFLTVCFPVAGQEARHSRGSQHRAATSAVRPLDEVSNFSIYRP